MLKHMKIRIIPSSGIGIFHDTKQDVIVLSNVCNTLIDKIDELVDKINELEKRNKEE